MDELQLCASELQPIYDCVRADMYVCLIMATVDKVTDGTSTLLLIARCASCYFYSSFSLSLLRFFFLVADAAGVFWLHTNLLIYLIAWTLFACFNFCCYLLYECGMYLCSWFLAKCFGFFVVECSCCLSLNGSMSWCSFTLFVFSFYVAGKPWCIFVGRLTLVEFFFAPTVNCMHVCMNLYLFALHIFRRCFCYFVYFKWRIACRHAYNLLFILCCFCFCLVCLLHCLTAFLG